MFKHLRAHDRTIEKAMEAIETYTKKIDAEADFSGGRALLKRSGVFIQVSPDEAHNILSIKAYINYISNIESAVLRDLYYHLLDLSDNPETGLAYFCITDGAQVGMSQDVIGVEVKHTLADMTWEAFEASIQAVEEVAAHHAPQIAEKYGLPQIG